MAGGCLLLTSRVEQLASQWLRLQILCKALSRTTALSELVKVSSTWAQRGLGEPWEQTPAPVGSAWLSPPGLDSYHPSRLPFTSSSASGGSCAWDKGPGPALWPGRCHSLQPLYSS